jgi:hypothetical protein
MNKKSENTKKKRENIKKIKNIERKSKKYINEKSLQ